MCEGLAKTVKALCDALHVPCVVALSHNNPEKGIKYRHAWNVVTIGGKNYHLDATFDNSLQRGEKRYDYFNLDDKHIFRDHERLVMEVPACSDDSGFYYRTISLTKMEQVESRIKQTLRKKKEFLVFHWRGGGLNRKIMEEILSLARRLATEKGKSIKCSLNVTQAVIQLQFMEGNVEDLTVQQPDEEREDRPVLEA